MLLLEDKSTFKKVTLRIEPVQQGEHAFVRVLLTDTETNARLSVHFFDKGYELNQLLERLNLDYSLGCNSK